MRATLLTAQRMADSIIKEAEEKRDGILQQAEAAAREKLDGYRREAEQCAKRLQQGQDEIQRFVAESRALCEKELRFLEEFPAMLLEESEPVSAAAEEIGEKILSAGEPAPAPAAAPTELGWGLEQASSVQGPDIYLIIWIHGIVALRSREKDLYLEFPV